MDDVSPKKKGREELGLDMFTLTRMKKNFVLKGMSLVIVV
jgi:hypothetical protein